MLNADVGLFVEPRLVLGMTVGPEIVQEFHIYQELRMSVCKNDLLSFHADKMVQPTYLCREIKGLVLGCYD